MSIAVSSTDGWRDAVADLRWLLRFRTSSLTDRQRRALRIAGLVLLALTLAAAVVPAYLPASVRAAHGGEILPVLPSFYLGFGLLASLSAAASGGGRELVPRDQAVAFPMTPRTDHLGALLLAPLNVSWLLQAWTLVGLTSFISGPGLLPLKVLPVVLWILGATAIGQVVAWLLEFVRRGRHGRLTIRLLTLVVAAGVGSIVMTGNLTHVLDQSPTAYIFTAVNAAAAHAWGTYATIVAILAALVLAAVALGAVPARLASARIPRDEQRLETAAYPARATARSELYSLMRVDRGSIWRSVPLRRGLVVLVVLPGLVALTGHLQWNVLTILPGLVGSGGALLFGVNTWCLDSRGVLWRENLPVSPRMVFAARALVLTEVLLGSAVVTVLIAVVRAAAPTPAELAALLMTTVVVVAQVVSASMRWSVRRPFAVDLRSARATPAPPAVMVGYSARLALSTTLTGMFLSGLANLRNPWAVVLVGLIFLLVSGFRIRWVAQEWDDPVVRARVAMTVAG